MINTGLIPVYVAITVLSRPNKSNFFISIIMDFVKIIKSKELILFLVVALTISCSGNRNRQKAKPVAKPIKLKEVPGTYLFDGKTLEGWEITSFGTEGPVDVSEGKIILNYGDGCTGVTYTKEFPTVNYEVFLEARKTSGNDFFCGITFPANNQFCSLVVGGWGGPVVGLSCIDGNDASENCTKTLKRFDKNVWYKIRLKVTGQKITAWIDNEKLVDFSYEGHKLNVRPEVELSKPFGICSWTTTGELRNIWIKEMDSGSRN